MSGSSDAGSATRARDDLLSGFVRTDFVLTFSVAGEKDRATLTELCAAEWQGTRVTDCTWEVTSALSPDALESAIVRFSRRETSPFTITSPIRSESSVWCSAAEGPNRSYQIGSWKFPRFTEVRGTLSPNVLTSAQTDR